MTFWDCNGSIFKGQNTHEEFFLDILTLDGEITKFCWNIANQLPNHAFSHPKTINTSATPAQKPKSAHLLDVTASPLFMSLKRAERSIELSKHGATSPTGNSGGGGGRPDGGGGGGIAAAPWPPQTKPVVWYCFTNCWSSVKVWIQDFTQSIWVLSLQKQTHKGKTS